MHTHSLALTFIQTIWATSVRLPSPVAESESQVFHSQDSRFQTEQKLLRDAKDDVSLHRIRTNTVSSHAFTVSEDNARMKQSDGLTETSGASFLYIE
jgi:hypothetical protein